MSNPTAQERAHILADLLRRHPGLGTCEPALGQACDLTLGRLARRGRILACGNGGSAADCDHIVGELMKGFLSPREPTSAQRQRLIDGGVPADSVLLRRLQRGIPAHSLSGPASLLTAIANDQDQKLVFAQQVYACGREEDVLLCLSTSGNSSNVVLAAQTARAIGIAVIALTGPRDCALDAHADVIIHAPGGATHEVQESHLALYHAYCAILEATLFHEDPTAQ